ncbi:Fe-S cluster assembly transcriptional regulator IscR [Exilibacterium tricleocarpae]|uniref:Fe-S cluster assembly transcriptional regulator IscR n=1 Tax=Exilibacterium tricleocarpae TaxID=2591008 RepID=A0A545U8C4_9GAMM|nr:Fe-S cluster assembly transcriptional regulator IscR [Exilibacterium tricleocarpae]TQV85708.1 Fe-S cluster assembly transcriptional regulator IscR [Exilibacterium tricleocarpae]
MRLTTKGRYAVTAMLDLALHSDKGPVSLAGISKRQEISLSYLEQLFAKLRQHKLVTSVRGPGGGYKLSRDAGELYVAEIVDAVNESIDATSCGGKSTCQHGEVCLTHYLWEDLSNQIHEFLSGISLASLVARRDVRAVSDRQDKREQEEQMKDRLDVIEASSLG